MIQTAPLPTFTVRELLPIFMVVYNFHRAHMSLKTTPAVKAGIADHAWSIEEIIGLLEAREQRAA